MRNKSGHQSTSFKNIPSTLKTANFQNTSVFCSILLCCVLNARTCHVSDIDYSIAYHLYFITGSFEPVSMNFEASVLPAHCDAGSFSGDKKARKRLRQIHAEAETE